MADFIVFGIDVLNGASESTLSGAGNNGQGTLTITGGTQPFEDDDIVVISAVNETVDGQLDAGSAIANITVYETRADYEAGIPKFTYVPQNPGQTASIESDVSGLGDGYVNFNANILIPQDGGPSFTRLIVAPGTDLADAASQPGGITLDRNEDFDFNDDGDFDDPIEQGDNLFFVGDYTVVVPCFTAGTLVRTPSGNVEIETLAPGDLVMTLDDGAQPIRWVGRRRVSAQRRMAPVHIAADSFGQHDALEVSQNHRVLRSGPAIWLLFASAEVLVAAKHLVDGRNVTIRTGGWVEYVHILFDDHQLIWANGLLSESLFPAVDNLSSDGPSQAASMEELRHLFGELFDPETALHFLAARRCLKKNEARLLVSAD